MHATSKQAALTRHLEVGLVDLGTNHTAKHAVHHAMVFTNPGDMERGTIALGSFLLW